MEKKGSQRESPHRFHGGTYIVVSLSLWILFVNNTMNSASNGAGIVFEGLDVVIIEKSLKFNFSLTHNQAKYKALHASMWLTRETRVKDLVAKGDSKVVMLQAKGEYQVEELQLAKYLKKVKELAQSFTRFKLGHLLGDGNDRGDILSKLGSAKKHGNQAIILETLD